MTTHVAQYGTAPAIVAAAKAVKESGFSHVDAVTPYHVADLSALLVKRDRRIQYTAIAGAAAGAVFGYLLEYYVAASLYPVMVAGRPFNSTAPFIPVTFEMMILGGALSTFVGLFLVLRLPKLHQPIFDTPGIARASKDRFLLLVSDESARPGPSLAEVLRSTQPLEVTEHHDLPS